MRELRERSVFKSWDSRVWIWVMCDLRSDIWDLASCNRSLMQIRNKRRILNVLVILVKEERRAILLQDCIFVIVFHQSTLLLFHSSGRFKWFILNIFVWWMSVDFHTCVKAGTIVE
jgi:hypothetical protein